MKKTLIIISILSITSFTLKQQLTINQEDLKATCNVLYKLTDEAINKNRKDLIAIYYNAYKSIRLTNEITDGCDQYFDEIRKNYSNDIGNWKVGLDIPPTQLSLENIGGFNHKQIETLNKMKELNLSLDDLDQFVLFKGIQENTVDLKLLKTSNTENIKLLNDNLNKLKIESIDYSKLNLLPNEKVKIEEIQAILEN